MMLLAEQAMTARQRLLLGALRAENDLQKIKIGIPPNPKGGWNDKELEIAWERVDGNGGLYFVQTLLPITVLENDNLTILEVVLRLRELADQAQRSLAPKKPT